MEFHEIQTIQCPTRQSFDDHLGIWDEIKKIGEVQKCFFKWEILNKEDRTFRLNVRGSSKNDQMNALIAVINFLQEKDIEPAIVIETKDLKETKKSIKKAIEICEEVV